KPPSSSKPKLYVVTPFPKSKGFSRSMRHSLSKPVTSNLITTPQESKVVKNDNVITPGMFRTNPFKPSKEEKCMPNKFIASVRTKPIIVSQPHVLTKKDVNSVSSGFSCTGVDNTAKTRRPQLRSNTKNDRIPSAFKSSFSINKEYKVEEHPRNLLLSKNKNICHLNVITLSLLFEMINVKLFVLCKQKANVSNITQQTTLKPHVKKPKKVGSNERLALLKPSKPRICLRWSPTGRIFDLCGKLIESSDYKCCSKHMTENLKLLINFVWKFLGTVRFENDHVAIILGFGDLQWGNILITKDYFVEGLGHNLFSVG
nr:integrase, catalytic region, zinc finger, CCHC-type, peptidase aspartic, catalytic [Tanacetum cinerariifolium]